MPVLKILETNISSLAILVVELELSQNIRGLEWASISDDTVPAQCRIIKYLNANSYSPAEVLPV